MYLSCSAPCTIEVTPWTLTIVDLQMDIGRPILLFNAV